MSSLIEGKWNHAVSSSMDRTIKVWDMSTIVQEAHPLARHTNPVLDLLSCETLGVAVARTRSCLGVWDLRTGRLHSTFARDSVGAKVGRLTRFHNHEEGPCTIKTLLYYDRQTLTPR